MVVIMASIGALIIVVVCLVEIVAESVRLAEVFLFVSLSLRDELVVVLHLIHG